MVGPEVYGNRFEVERVVRRNDDHTLFKARDVQHGSSVALRVLRQPTMLCAERLRREADILRRLSHPGCVRLVAHSDTSEGRHYLATQWVEGRSLAELLASDSALTDRQFVTLMRCVAEALGAAHALGIVHRRLTPTCIFVPDGAVEQAKVLDFDVALLLEERRVTPAGVVIGTPGFMAPEQARGDKQVDARADVFALGCVLFECLTGRPAFAAQSRLAVLLKVVLEPPPRLRDVRDDVSHALDVLVGRMLARDPDKRPADGAAVAAELAALRLKPKRRTKPRSGATELTVDEQRIVSVIVAAAESKDDARSEQGARAGPPAAQSQLQVMQEALRSHGARFETLLDGSMVAMVSGADTPAEQAVRAAHCALAMRAARPGIPMVLATGRGVVRSRMPVGDIIERAALLLDNAPPDAVRIDEVTAGLLEARFDVHRGEEVLLLRGELEPERWVRTLLGRRTSCVGRDRELFQIESIYDWCLSEPAAAVVLVTAPSGFGKSRLRYELVRRLRDRGEEVEILFGHGDPLSPGGAYGMLGSAIRRWAGIFSGEPLEAQRDKLRARITQRIPKRDAVRVAEFIGEMVGVPFPDDGRVQLQAARRNPRLMADQVRGAWESWLRAECEAQPVLLVLEDLQWGDLPTIQLVDGALRSLEAPLLVLGLGHPEVHQHFGPLWANRDVTELKLGGLPRKACIKLTREVLGDMVRSADVAQLVKAAGGNAFYLEELIRAAARGQRERPETALGMVQGRLINLEAGARRVLRAASVFGYRFWHDGVAALLGGERQASRVERWLDELLRREVIVRSAQTVFPGQQEYTFWHSMVREGAYAMLTETDRAVGHRLAGEWLERMGETGALVLAEHYRRSDEPQRAVDCYVRAAKECLDANDLEAALAQAEQGVGCGATGQTLGMLRLIGSEAHRWRGEYALARDAALEAARCFEIGSTPWFRAIRQVTSSASRLDRQELFASCVARLRAAEPLDDDAALAKLHALCRAASMLMVAGHLEGAQALVLQAEQNAGEREARDPLLHGRICRVHAFQGYFDGDLGTAVMFNKASIESFERAGDERAACRERINMGFTFLELGAYDRAEAVLRDALAAAQQMGIEPNVATARHNLGLVLAHCGDHDAGLALERMAVDAFHTQGYVRLEGGSRIYLAQIHVLAGDLVAAEREARRAIEILGPFPPAYRRALAVFAQALLALGRRHEALEAAVAGMRHPEAGGKLEGGEALLRLVHAEALRATGDHDLARVALCVARERLLERADKISDRELRESFLKRVPENVRTLRLAAAWEDEGVDA